MAPKKTNANKVDWKSELLAGGDVVRELFRDVLLEVLEAEMTETRGRSKRSRKNFAATRSARARSATSCNRACTWRVNARDAKTLDEQLAQFATRRLDEEYPYLILDARYERVRENGTIHKRAVLVAIGINWDGRRCVLGVDRANRESISSWKEFLLGLRTRGLTGVELVVTDDHAGLRAAIAEVLPDGATSAKRATTWPPGSRSGKAATPSWWHGSKRTSRRRSRSTGFPRNTTNT
jgi:transposase-like protein